MKKSGVILVLVMSVLLISVIISISFVSAGLPGDIWNKITGKATEENTTAESEVAPEEPKPVEEKCPEVPISMWCPDEKTLCPQTKDEKGCLIWNCNACEAEPKEDKIICCAITPILEEPVPTRYEWGLESQCDPTSVGVSYAKVSEEYCIKRIEPIPTEPREVEEAEKIEEKPEVCAVKIKISSNQKVYYMGDNVGIIVEIFDEQGNLLPNYPFYSQIYDGKKWQSPSKESTSKEGSYKHIGTVKESDNFGKGSVKVFTRMAGCNSVEDILEVEIKKGKEKEEICGIGVCVPEEGEKAEEIPEEKEILYSCTGCKLEGKCYSFGYRKAEGYCSENYEFVSQKEEGVCENNFECKSNVCVSDECVSEGLIKKIIAWFKGLLGKEESEEPEQELKAEMCSDLLIEKNIREYNYFQSAYGNAKESQAPLYSEEGEQIGIVKCCVAGYSEPDGESKGTSALVCPYDNRADIENSLKWLSARGELALGEYKGQKVYNVGNAIIWTHKEFILVVGRDPKTSIPFPEEIANAYLDEYPNDLESVEIPKASPTQIQGSPEKFLDEAEKLGKVTLINFETLPDGTILQNGNKLTGKEWESLGVIFETPGEDYLQVFGPLYPFNPLDKLSLSPGLGPFEAGGDTHDDLNIVFSEPVKAAGLYLLDLGATDERESITFFDKNNNIIKKISPWPKSTFGNPAPGTFVYLIEDGISKIEILENTQDGDDIAYDNLYFTK